MLKSTLTLVLLGASLPALSLAQDDDASPAIAAPATTTRSTLESLASLGQVGLSFLNTFLNPVTQSTTARPTSTPQVTTTPATRLASTTQASVIQSSSTLPSIVTFSQPSTLRTSASSTSTTSRAYSSSTTSSTQSSTQSSTSPASVTDAPVATSSKKSNTLAIALGVTFGILALALLLFLLWFCLRRRRRHVRPDSPLSDSSYGEKAMPRTGVTSFSTDRTLLHSEPTSHQPLLHTAAPAAGAGAAAGTAAAAATTLGINRKPIPAAAAVGAHRTSRTPQGASFPVEPPMQQGYSGNNYSEWYNGGSSPYPQRASQQRPRSWAPAPVHHNNTTSSSSLINNASAAGAAAPLVSPIDNDDGDHGYNNQYHHHNPSHTNSGWSRPRYRSYRPVSEQAAPHRYYASPQRPDGYGIQPQYRPRRYSGGSAWQGCGNGGAGVAGRPRSTPLSPLAQYPS